MKPSEVAMALQNPSLLTDITHPRPRQAVQLAAEFMFDLAEVIEAAEFWLAAPHDDLRRQLMANVIERTKARAAA